MGWKQSYTLDKSLGAGSQRGINKNKQPFTLTHTHTDSSEITVAEDCSKPDCLAESSSISRTHIQATKPLLIFIVCMVLLLLAHKLILLLLLLGQHKFPCLWINQVYFLLHAYCWTVGNCRRTHTEPVRGPSTGMEHTTFRLWGNTASRCTGWFNLSINKHWGTCSLSLLFCSLAWQTGSPLAKSLCNALLRIRTFTQFLCNIWSELPTQACQRQTQQGILLNVPASPTLTYLSRSA